MRDVRYGALSLRVVAHCVIACFGLIYIGALSGCATDVAKLEHFSKIYYTDSAHKAYKFAKAQAKGDDVLWLIQAGISGFHAQSEDALQLLDTSEEKLLAYERDGILISSLGKVGATLVNDNATDYRGTIYEGVFVNYYKALSYLRANDIAGARVELNRANDRQRRAKEYYDKQIQKALQSEQERYTKSEANGRFKDQAMGEIDTILHKHYTNLDVFRAFKHFINPSISYLSGLIFSLQDDNKGLNYLKEAYGITHSPIIAEDLAYFLRKNGAKHSENSNTSDMSQVWILLEEGRQARKIQEEFELPFIPVSGGIYHFGIALPQLESNKSSADSYVLDSGADFSVLAHIDEIIATEFEKQLQAIATRALVSSSIKLAIQIALQEGLSQVDAGIGLLGSIVGTIYSKATMSADLRITSVLPRRILLAKITSHTPQTRQILAVRNGIKTPLHTLEIRHCEKVTQESTTQAQQHRRTKHKNADSKHATAICLGSDAIIYVRDTFHHHYVSTLYEKPHLR